MGFAFSFSSFAWGINMQLDLIDLIDYIDLQQGETRKVECPSCGKGKFYVTRKTEGLAYICFRASCGTQGFVQDYGSTVSNETTTVKPRKNYEWTGMTHTLSTDDVDYFEDRFGLTPNESLNDILRTSDGRYAFPLYGGDESLRGHVIRRATWQGVPSAPIQDNYASTFPKALTYIHPDVPRCGWYHSTREDIVVMVEDCVSAVRVAQEGYTAVALLGTTLAPKVLGELLRWKNGKTYILALDPDAIDKARKIQRDYGGAFPGGLRVAELKCDPKDYIHSRNLLHDLNLI